MDNEQNNPIIPASSDDAELEQILAEDWDSIPDIKDISSAEEPSPEAAFFEDASVMEDPTIEVLPNQDPTITAVPNSFASPEEPDQPAAENIDASLNDDTRLLFTADEIIAEFSGSNSSQTEDSRLEDTAYYPMDEQFPAEDPSLEDTAYYPMEDQFPAEAESQQVSAPDNAEQDIPVRTRIRKIRPAPKKGYGLMGIPHILSTVIWLAIILLIGLTLGHSLWSGITDLMAFGKPDQQITITITDSEVMVLPDGTKAVNAEAVANKLKEAGLITNPQWFVLFSSTLTDKANDIDPGTYTLNTKFDYNAMINNMQNHTGAREEVEILIPEGYTCAQIFSLLQEKNVCDVEDLEAYLTDICEPDKDGVYALSDYWFLEDTPRSGKYWLEGYLFPDTYRFYVDDDPENVIKKFLDGFDFRFTDIMREKMDTIEERTGLDLTVHEVIVIASMIEKETAGGSDSYMISSVIYNRLGDNSHDWHLNIDATIYYALGGNIDPETGLAKPLTQADMNIDHPYNTYKYTGLPPGAIANPGRNSLDAALTPEQDGYNFYLFENGMVKEVEKDADNQCFYYVYNPHDQVHIFSETESNQEKAIEYIKSLG